MYSSRLLFSAKTASVSDSGRPSLRCAPPTATMSNNFPTGSSGGGGGSGDQTRNHYNIADDETASVGDWTCAGGEEGAAENQSSSVNNKKEDEKKDKMPSQSTNEASDPATSIITRKVTKLLIKFTLLATFGDSGFHNKFTAYSNISWYNHKCKFKDNF
jgi:hypothetical protein